MHSSLLFGHARNAYRDVGFEEASVRVFVEGLAEDYGKTLGKKSEKAVLINVAFEKEKENLPYAHPCFSFLTDIRSLSSF